MAGQVEGKNQTIQIDRLFNTGFHGILYLQFIKQSKPIPDNS